jgi:peptidoglycan-associated lipoprotein
MFAFRMVSYTCLSVFIILAFAGCATKTDPSSKAADSGPSDTGAGSTRASNLPSASDQDKAPPRSSLEELQAGKKATSGPLRDVLFEYDQYELTVDARDILKANADWLKKNPSARVEIEGHCDERGTNEYNMALGAKRSQTAKDYLVRLGIAADRLSTISYGEEIPVCTEPSENCWRQNRRARSVVSPSLPTS